jgi:hypothetical protein
VSNPTTPSMPIDPRALAPRIPTRRDAVSFWLRSRLLDLAHRAKTLGARPRRWARSDALADAPIVASSTTPLWRDADTEFALVAGKVENLRIAVRAFDGVVAPAGEVLSFWRQLGAPSARRGFVLGREVREGCVIPTRGGGLCQLSNALATAAARATFELVERHRHTATLHDASATGRVDATVFWSYVDLKIRADVAWRIEASLDAERLVVVLRAADTDAATRDAAAASPARASMTFDKPPSRTLRNCHGCDETACFRHRADAPPARAREAWLLDALTSELATFYATSHSGAKAPASDADADSVAARDVFAPATSSWFRSLRRGRPLDAFSQLRASAVHRAIVAGARRIVWQRLCARRAGLRQRSLIDGQRWLATHYARRLTPQHARLVVDQSLLAHLERLGALGGRRYDVLATALPMREIERRLDAACALDVHNEAARATLSDFRVDGAIADAELRAFARAARITTPHADVAEYWRARGVLVHRIPWSPPSIAVQRAVATGPRPIVVFPTSALARKGAYVLAAALRGLDVRLRVLGSRSDDPSLFDGIDVEYAPFGSSAFADAALVVLPAFVEHSPRALRAAEAAGIPVVATPAVGLDASDGVMLVAAGDVGALRDAMVRSLG